MKVIFEVVLFVAIIVGSIVVVIASIMGIVSLIEPWFYFLSDRYYEWVEEIQKNLNRRREKKKLIKEKLKELIDESNINDK